MTREEAIAYGKECLSWNKFSKDMKMYQFIEMAIKALSQEPCDDAEHINYYDDFVTALKKISDYKRINDMTDEEVYKRFVEPYHKFNKSEPCDAISREDAEQMFRNIRSHLKPQDYKSAEEFNTRDLMLLNAEQMIHALPSVTQKLGKWIEHPEIETSAPEYLMFYECSECGDKQCFCKSDIHKKRFCHNCGARMESDAE